MLIPLKDENPTYTKPIVTVGLIILNVLVWLYQTSLGPAETQFILQLGAIPAQIVYRLDLPPADIIPAPLTLISAMFLHGGLMHMGGNMLYLWIFGNNIEDALGSGRFILFYLLTGIAASFGHIVAEPGSEMPMIGASGAVSGILGAYIVLYPRANVVSAVWIIFIIRLIRIPAIIFLGIWFLMQVMSAGNPHAAGVAWWAHIGGFAAGALLVWLFRRDRGAGRYRVIDLDDEE
jgi:membrane associated rhomboid family serine protease